MFEFGGQVGELSVAPLRLFPGECLAVDGPSGSGKTRLLRILADLDPHQATIRLNDRAQQDYPAPEWRSRVALLPAESAWWLDSVGEHMPPGAAEWLPPLGLDPEAMHWQVARLSSGEKQRLALARLLARRPQLLLLDEPTANLDRGNGRLLEDLVTRYLMERQATAIWVSHDPQQRQRVATRQCLIRDGRLQEQEPPA